METMSNLDPFTKACEVTTLKGDSLTSQDFISTSHAPRSLPVTGRHPG